MATDYFSILSKAIATAPDAAARQAIYTRARKAVAALNGNEGLTLSQIATEAKNLEAAIGRLEDEIAAEANRAIEPLRSEDISPAEPPLKSVIGLTRWRFVAAFTAIVAAACIAVLWVVLGGRSPQSASDRGRPPLALVDPKSMIVAELAPGVDGGSSSDDLPFAYQRQVVFYRSNVVAGSIVVDRDLRFLYLIQSGTSARRYGIGISSECRRGGSLYRVVEKVEWPAWGGSRDRASTTGVTTSNPGGPGSPLGARMLVLDQSERLIHGTNSPQTIGHMVATGCLRLVNDDVEDLYRRVALDTRVIMRN